MSKIGRKPIIIPSGVDVKVEPLNQTEQLVLVKGGKNEQKISIPVFLNIVIDKNTISLSPANEKRAKEHAASWGLYRALLANIIIGVSQGFSKRLILEGVGFKASLDGKKLILNLGFSHPVEFMTPEGIDFKVEKNVITVSGISKELVGHVSAEIRSIKPPEPYKGKGIRYDGEVIRRKAGKKAATA